MSATILPFKRPSADVVKAKKAEIAKRYRKRKKRKLASATQFTAIRIAELNRVLTSRYGEQVPNDATGRKAIAIVAHHLVRLDGHPKMRLSNWASLHARWLTIDRIESILCEAVNRPRKWKADTLAHEIGLTMEERQRLRITTIGAVDCNKDERKARRKELKRQRDRARYHAKKNQFRPP